MSKSGKEIVCGCELPPRICLSKTEKNPGKKFMVCPNSLTGKKKCDFWKWVEEGESSVQDHDDLRNEVMRLRKELEELKNKMDRDRCSITCCNIV